MKVPLFFLAVVLVSGGCDGRRQTEAVKVRIGYFPNVTHAQAVLGVSSGEFEAALGSDHFGKPVTFNAGPSLIEALFDGDIDVGYVGPGPVINAAARSHGEGIRVVSGAAANGVIVVAAKDSGIKTLADLKGKRVGTPQSGNTQDVACRHYLSTIGQTTFDNVKPAPNAQQPALMAGGQLDAAWCPEPWGSLMISKLGAVSVAEEKSLWPGGDFSLTVIVTTPKFLAAHRDLLDKLLTVHRSWTERLNREPTRYAAQLNDALAVLNGGVLPAGVVASSLSRVKFTNDPLPATFTAEAQWSVDLHFSREVPDLSTLFVRP